jgi:tetratricopeptide (TPR) repeat protein
MKNFRHAINACSALLAIGLLLSSVTASVVAQEPIRLSVGTPLTAAQDLMKVGNFKAALIKLSEVDLISDRTATENYYLERLRSNAASNVGDDALASRSFSALVATEKLSKPELIQTYEALTIASLRAKDYSTATSAAKSYFMAGGEKATMRPLQLRAHYLSGDFSAVTQFRQSGYTDEPSLSLIAASYVKLGDETGYESALEDLLVHHGKTTYWVDRLARLQANPKFDARLGLALYRLQLATDTIESAEQYIEMAQLAKQAGQSSEAKKVIDAGFRAKKLGVGSQAENHKIMQNELLKQTRDDETFLLNASAKKTIDQPAGVVFNNGFALLNIGKTREGIELMEQAIKKPGLRQLGEAKLLLGQAYFENGFSQKAIELFKTINGTDAVADLARLWAILATKASN